MELTDWRQLSDRGPDLVPCLDFPGGRAAAGFAELAEGVAADACFLHFRQVGAGRLAACVDRWADELLATGRPVRAVLGYCAGTALATRLADAIAATGPPPMVVLFDAVSTTGGSLASQFTSVLESSARHLTADELADACGLSEQLVASEGGFDMRTTTPLFLTSPGYEPPVEGARTIALDIGHADLLRAPQVHELVADLLTGEHPW